MEDHFDHLSGMAGQGQSRNLLLASSFVYILLFRFPNWSAKHVRESDYYACAGGHFRQFRS